VQDNLTLLRLQQFADSTLPIGGVNAYTVTYIEARVR
jgi:hypothetical protein